MPAMFGSTMCVCGDMQTMADIGADNVFTPHTSRRTGERCPGIPQTPSPNVKRITERMIHYERLLIRHSVFAYPHFWLWHALFDGTWLCRCWHSRELK